MAEVVGVVASAFTIGGVAVGSGRLVLRLKQLWDEVKEVPATIQGLLQKISILESVLLEIEQVSLSPDPPDDNIPRPTMALQKSTEHCKRHVQLFVALVSDLESEINSAKRTKRSMGKVKVVLGKSKLAGFERRMRDAVDLLVIAMNARNMVLSEQMSRTLVPKAPCHFLLPAVVGKNANVSDDDICHEKADVSVDDTVAQCHPQAASVTTVTSRHPRRSKVRQAAGNPGWLGKIDFGRHHASSASWFDASTDYYLRMQAPTWLYGKAFDFQFTRTVGAWNINLRTYNIRPNLSPAFLMMISGDISGVFELFSQRLASPYDCNEAGCNLLHLCCLDFAAATPKNIKLLLDVGISPTETSRYGYTPLQNYFLISRHEGGRSHRFIEGAVEALKSHDYDECLTSDLDLSIYLLRSHTHTAALRKDWERVSWAQREIMPYLALAASGRLVNLNIQALRCLHLYRATEIIEQERLYSEQGLGNWLCLHEIALWYGLSCRWNSGDHQDSRHRQDLMFEALKKNSSAHSATCYNWNTFRFGHSLSLPIQGYLSPLLHFLCGAWVLNCSRLYELKQPRLAILLREMEFELQRWLASVTEAGFNLEVYGLLSKEHVRRDISPFRWDSARWRDVWVPGTGWSVPRPEEGSSMKRNASIFDEDYQTVHFSAPKLVDLIIGPQADGWKLVWDFDFEEMAGEFWDMVENPLLTLPGAWDSEWS